MKTLIVAFSIFIIPVLGLSQSVDNKAENLGLISELVYIKLSSEDVAIRLSHDTITGQTEKNKYINYYNEIKIITDQIIIQLITDCRLNNSISYYKKIDQLLVRKTIDQSGENDVKNPKLKGYVKNLKRVSLINSQLNDYNPQKRPGLKFAFPSISSLGDIKAILDFITATIKDISENKAKRVEKLVDILNSLRLKSSQELLKDKF
jgi:hypothetical protein